MTTDIITDTQSDNTSDAPIEEKFDVKYKCLRCGTENNNSELITLIVSRAEIVDYRKDYVEKMANNNNILNIFYIKNLISNF